MNDFSLPERRHPHKEILDVLGNVVYEVSAENVLFSIDAIRMRLSGFDYEQIHGALRELRAEGPVIEQSYEKYALSRYEELIDADRWEYEALKARVREAAKQHGLWPIVLSSTRYTKHRLNEAYA